MAVSARRFARLFGVVTVQPAAALSQLQISEPPEVAICPKERRALSSSKNLGCFIYLKTRSKEHSFMTKQLQFNARARDSIKKGVDTLTNAVKVTIGPKGRNVVLDMPFETPNILNDGVAIARGIDLEEPFTNMGLQLVKEATIKTNDMAGDGTTTATILVQAILAEGLKNIAAGANAMLLRNVLE